VRAIAVSHRSPHLTPLEERALDEPTDADWCPRCWNRWIRARLLEHLAGDCYWQELDRDDFALLRRTFHPSRVLICEIVRQLAAGSENLTVIDWALQTGRPLADTLEILAAIDINARRIPRFAFLAPATLCRAAG
jgi:hypothetical protein